jgi:prepilin-type N-terminal cleavage/methylation domain-containing protein
MDEQDIQDAARRGRRGFTLVELLVAMSMLVVIVMIIGMFFQRASVAWDTGARKAEVLLTGRAVADYISQEMEMAMPIANTWNVSGSSASFMILGEATATLRATQTVSYAFSGGVVTRNGQPMCEGVGGLDFVEEVVTGDPNELPLWVDIKVTVTNEFGPTVFHSRATFPNRGREG